MPPIDDALPAPRLAHERGPEAQRRFVAALAAHLAQQHGVPRATVIETHISHVLIAGDTAYKLKKPLRLPFVDYSTLERRRRFCEEELRLNRRLAPSLYRDVVAIRGSVEHPVPGGTGEVIEYAVRMRAFAQDDLMAAWLARGQLPASRIDELAQVVAHFHAGIAVASAETPFGTPAQALADALENFDEILPLAGAARRHELEALRRWTHEAFALAQPAMAQRKRDGFVRECHGDLHLGNAAIVDGHATLFDGIEFDPRLRWIDVMSEAAFAAMDLADRGRDDLAWRFFNRYLEATGDYAGVTVLRFHLVYRALVRAKVRYLRGAQVGDTPERAAVRTEAGRYVDLAWRLARAWQPAVVVTHGPAGAGKTTLTQALVERLPALRVRSDVERKRLHGLPALVASGSTVDGGLYAAEATTRTYGRLADAAAAIVAAGYAVVLDGTFLKRWQRDRMRARANELRTPFAIVDVRVSERTLRERVAARAAAGTDASEATLEVLEHQLAGREPLAEDERSCAVVVDGEAPDPDALVDGVRSVLGRRR